MQRPRTYTANGWDTSPTETDVNEKDDAGRPTLKESGTSGSSSSSRTRQADAELPQGAAQEQTFTTSPFGGSEHHPPNDRQMTTMTTRSSGTRHKRHHKAIERIPFFRLPAKDEGKWLEEGHQASIWVSLFYDLAMVAVLTVFSSTHELSTPTAIPIYLSYFVILSWVWTSQVHYDIRYQAEDTFHRLIKGFQIGIFVYIGAASGNWNLYSMESPGQEATPLSAHDAAEHLAGQNSYTTIMISFIVSRGLLLLQYGVTIWLGRIRGRNIWPCLASFLSIVGSILFSIVAVALPFNNSSQLIAKATLVYVSILVETLGIRFQFTRKGHTKIDTEDVADRYGALTLIILGEGFISLTRAFSLAISGLSNSNTATYLQVFLVIAIICFMFLYLFGRFKKEDSIDENRALIWEAVHFPLHFCILLLLASMVNVVVVLSYSHGIDVVSQQFSATIEQLAHNTTICSGCNDTLIDDYLAYLPLQPSYGTEWELLKNVTFERPRKQDSVILGVQYFGQIVFQTTTSYGIEVTEEMLDLYEQIYSLNVTWQNDNATMNELRSQGYNLSLALVQEPVNRELSGILWLYPSAGGVLVFSAIRSMIWYKFEGLAHWVIHAPMIVAGVFLALLGLLDIGDRTITISQSGNLIGNSAIYNLLWTNLPLLIVALVYLFVYFGALIAMHFIHKRKGGIYLGDEGAHFMA